MSIKTLGKQIKHTQRKRGTTPLHDALTHINMYEAGDETHHDPLRFRLLLPAAIALLRAKA